jgi:hypothetical protein
MGLSWVEQSKSWIALAGGFQRDFEKLGMGGVDSNKKILYFDGATVKLIDTLQP